MFRTCCVLFLSVMSVSLCQAQPPRAAEFMAQAEALAEQSMAERRADQRHRELVGAIRRQGLENQAVLEDALIRQQGEWNRRQINAFYAPTFRQYQAGTMMGFQAWQAQTMRGFNSHYYGQPTRRRSR